MGYSDEIRRGMGQAEIEDARRQAYEQDELAAEASRRERIQQISSGITWFLGVMRRHGYPGTVELRGRSVQDAPKPPPWRSLWSTPSSAPAVRGWQVGQEWFGPDALPVYVVLTVDGRLFVAHRENGPVDRDGNWGQMYWVRERELELTGVLPGSMDARLADSILLGIGRILHDNALAGPDQ